MKTLQRINAIELLPLIDQKLIELLESLSIADWSRQTIAPEWKVKDVATHLLDGNLRTLSMLRDNYFGEVPVQLNSYEDTVKYLNALNADWVKGTSRLSPTVIIDLLKSSGEEYCHFLKTLDPEAQATFSVAWAGEHESKNWFHIAREYTEKWHHQQQIRLAVGKDNELLKEQWYMPYLDTSVRALPHHYSTMQAEENTLIKFIFRGKKDKYWLLKYQAGKWELFTEMDEVPTCVVIINDEYAWRIFTKGVDKMEAINKSQIIGQRDLGLRIFEMIAVMA